MRRTIIAIALMLAALVGHAQTVAVMPNGIGGTLELMRQRGKCPEGDRIIIARAPTGQFALGCWAILDGKVFAVFADGDNRIYDLDRFKLTPAGQAWVNSKDVN